MVHPARSDATFNRSTHIPNFERVARAAIDSDQLNAMMLAFHHRAWPLPVSPINEYLQASAQALTTNDVVFLEKYDQLMTGTQYFPDMN